MTLSDEVEALCPCRGLERMDDICTQDADPDDEWRCTCWSRTSPRPCRSANHDLARRVGEMERFYYNMNTTKEVTHD